MRRGQWVLVLVLVVVLVAAVVACVLLSPRSDWPTVLVAIIAVGIAGGFGIFQTEVARRQTELAEAVAQLTKRQIDLQEVIRLLTYMPVLTGDFRDPPKGYWLLLHNAGNGPAMDVRAALLPRIDAAERGVERTPLKAECSRSHVGPKGDAYVSRPSGYATPPGGSSKDDVWIVHCGDVNGQQYHLVSNSTGNGPPGDSPDGTWRWWREDQAPVWVSNNCYRCQELEAIEHRTRQQEAASRQRANDTAG